MLSVTSWLFSKLEGKYHMRSTKCSAQNFVTFEEMQLLYEFSTPPPLFFAFILLRLHGFKQCQTWPGLRDYLVQVHHNTGKITC